MKTYPGIRNCVKSIRRLVTSGTASTLSKRPVRIYGGRVVKQPSGGRIERYNVHKSRGRARHSFIIIYPTTVSRASSPHRKRLQVRPRTVRLFGYIRAYIRHGQSIPNAQASKLAGPILYLGVGRVEHSCQPTRPRLTIPLARYSCEKSPILRQVNVHKLEVLEALEARHQTVLTSPKIPNRRDQNRPTETSGLVIQANDLIHRITPTHVVYTTANSFPLPLIRD